jgi:ABC-type nitrate/sulfonate/bicarbonate transport system substrate-binding protein
MRLAVPDLVSNSYFPAVAAATLGAFAEQGLDISLELVSPLPNCIDALLDGSVHFVGASAHAPLLSFPEWKGASLLCAQSQGTYWLLVMRRELAIARGDVAALRGRRIAAVPFVGAVLKRILLGAGIDPIRDGVDIMVPEAASKPGINFGVAAADALRDATIDGFFANGVGAEMAVRDGVGVVVLDIRRGHGPKDSFHYTMPAIATTTALIAEAPDVAAKIIRAVVKTQAALKEDISLATAVGAKIFPARAAALIGAVVERDLPYYEPSISEAFVGTMNQFSREIGLLAGEPSYHDIVATQLSKHWSLAPS